MSTNCKNQSYKSPPPAYSQTTNPNNKSNLTYGNPYNQYPAGFQNQTQAQKSGYVYQQNDGGQIQSTVAVINQPGPAPMVVSPVPHRNWMVPAVLTCLCCFWPTGIFAIKSASKANSAAARGDVVETEKQSRHARNLVIASIVLGIIFTTVIAVVRYMTWKNTSRYY